MPLDINLHVLLGGKILKTVDYDRLGQSPISRPRDFAQNIHSLMQSTREICFSKPFMRPGKRDYKASGGKFGG